MQRCLFCKTEIDAPIPKIREGGKVCFCKSCIQKLINEGQIEMHVDNSVSLNGSLYKIIFSYSLL